MNPLAKYSLARLALFVAVLAVTAWAGASLLTAIVLAAVVSALLSYLLLRPWRDQVSRQLAARAGRRLPRGVDELAEDEEIASRSERQSDPE